MILYTNNYSEIVDSVNIIVEPHDGIDKPDDTIPITLYPSTIKRVKSAGRITNHQFHDGFLYGKEDQLGKMTGFYDMYFLFAR